ncbi:hypothetical protein JOC34_000586 [Virgibacillus halotolerans]|nr:hypothetical protein [Virgibacillus halotolerans]MBM7598229.1 hypothetical protein [Virgibacillus halotolerans]
MDELTISDIEAEVQERMETLERQDRHERLNELQLFMDWLLCGDDYTG